LTLSIVSEDSTSRVIVFPVRVFTKICMVKMEVSEVLWWLVETKRTGGGVYLYSRVAEYRWASHWLSRFLALSFLGTEQQHSMGCDSQTQLQLS
jgi:hypothetical protein